MAETKGLALVTGASGGLGQAICRKLASDGYGLVAAGRSMDAMWVLADELAGITSRVEIVHLDLLDPASIDKAFETVDSLSEPLDVLVANGGVAGPVAPLVECDFAAWTEAIMVNVIGTALTLRAGLDRMTRRGGGSAVVIGSMTGKRPLASRTSYATSKAALIGLVRTASAEVGTAGVRVNLVSPGPVNGERLQDVVRRQAEESGLESDEILARLLADSHLGRPVSAEEVASAVAFLAGDASLGITGEDMNVSGGSACY